MGPTRHEPLPAGESGHGVTHDSRTSRPSSGDGFATALRTRREARGWNRTELAAALAYDRTYVSHVEGGTRMPSRTFAERADAVLEAAGVLLASWTTERGGAAPAAPRPSPRLELLDTHRAVQDTLSTMVGEAARVLVCAGSRSRDAEYLRLIEDRLTAEPDLVYYRLLFGPPRHRELRDHLLHVLEIRDPTLTSRGAGKSVFIGMFEDDGCEPERFICVNERRALLPQLSLHGLSWYDTALVVNDPSAAAMWMSRMQEAYRAGTPVETAALIAALPIVRERTP